MDPSHADEITRFVRGALGCQCPDDVFQSIVIAHERTPDNGAPFTRLLVGDRLLIYLVPSSSIEATPDTLAALARKVGPSVMRRATTASDWSWSHTIPRLKPPLRVRASSTPSVTTTKHTCTS